jgi:SAM-dependent methyltransferase
MPADYEYRGLMAENWDLLRGDTSGWTDAAWFQSVVEQGAGPSLDVGCGTGRTLLDFLARDLDVDGLDNSPEMLALCRAKGEAAGFGMAGRLHCGKMQAFDLPRRYATIFVPSTSIERSPLSTATLRAAAASPFPSALFPGTPASGRRVRSRPRASGRIGSATRRRRAQTGRLSGVGIAGAGVRRYSAAMANTAMK